MAGKSECVFCRIVKQEIPSANVFESESTLAFLDIYPVAKGHTLVIPKNHYETLLDVPEFELGQLALAVKKVGKAVVKSMEADGFNLLQSNKPEAGQVIPHVHFHVVPRKKEDGLNFNQKARQMAEDELKGVQEKIKKEL